MLEDLKEDEIVSKVGGRFKLATLIQKRLIALNQGSRALVDHGRSLDKMSIVIAEIMEDKIFLDTSGNVQTAHEAPEEIEGGTVDLTQSD
jgi:DNA-directed RNA polymerase subunit omega